ncbi:TorF family putative porin [Thiothrix lacustris]|uniref:TorF family putative porin n=1 Tax=Thiothrix lacustris TaxID=525917 RepID=A0ABY9MLZ5_9GAMM|nr:TorF family putative porin [Thiothrix lacustris]WML89597.1 TorF family putative porin [Thiothrix lacustris]
MKKTLLTMAVMGSLLVVSQAQAGASANIGVTSDYIWRGVTQTDEGAAVQAGLDYEADNGLYVGTWASNVDFPDVYNGAEVDVYAGYKKDLKGELNFDVGAIRYMYPSEDMALDATEVYAKAGLKGLEAEVSYGVDTEGTDTDEGNLYYGLGYSGEFSNGIGYGAKIGRVDYEADGASDYSHTQLSLSKGFDKAGDVTLAVDDSTLPDTDPLVSVSWAKSFDF